MGRGEVQARRTTCRIFVIGGAVVVGRTTTRHGLGGNEREECGLAWEAETGEGDCGILVGGVAPLSFLPSCFSLQEEACIECTCSEMNTGSPTR